MLGDYKKLDSCFSLWTLDGRRRVLLFEIWFFSCIFMFFSLNLFNGVLVDILQSSSSCICWVFRYLVFAVPLSYPLNILLFVYIVEQKILACSSFHNIKWTDNSAFLFYILIILFETLLYLSLCTHKQAEVIQRSDLVDWLLKSAVVQQGIRQS